MPPVLIPFLNSKNQASITTKVSSYLVMKTIFFFSLKYLMPPVLIPEKKDSQYNKLDNNM